MNALRPLCPALLDCLQWHGSAQRRPSPKRSTIVALLAGTGFLMNSAAGNAAAQVAAPSSVPFDGSILKPYENAWRYVATSPDGSVHPQGIWTDQLLKTKRDGKDVFIRIQGTVYVNGKTSSTINVFDPKTMLPVSDQQTLREGGDQKRQFGTNSVESVRPSPSGAGTKTTTALPSSIYDYYGGMYALLIATAPLHEGYSGVFTSIDEFEDKPVDVAFSVVGRERVNAGSKGSVTAWKVHADRPGQYDLVAWVTNSPPYVIRLNVTMPDKRSFDWTML